MQYQENTTELLVNRERKGNKQFTSERKGERIDKRTGEQEVISEDEHGGITVRGSLLTSVIIKDIIKTEKKLLDINMNVNERKKYIISPKMTIVMNPYSV